MPEEHQIKRPVGRPPKHPPSNQYTGIRAKNIDYIRQTIRLFIEREKVKEEVGVTKMVVQACRILLACEGIFFMVSPPLSDRKKDKARERLVELGKGVHAGTVTLPQLLNEIDGMERRITVEGDSDEVQGR